MLILMKGMIVPAAFIRNLTNKKMPFYRVQKPFIFTLFGASGDLAKIKIFPALYKLAEQNRLPEQYFIVGFARTEKTQIEFREEFAASIRDKYGKEVKDEILKKILKNIYYYSGQYGELENFRDFRNYLEKICDGRKLMHLAYFSVPPQVFKSIIESLGRSRKSPNEDMRLIIEKPFGEDEHSARELYHFVSRYFEENQVYLLDHYLGKTAVQSLLHLRHSNRLLNFFMKGAAVSNIQITAFENIGVENRVGYFDQVGIIKDMIQSHLLQVLALITMSIPITEQEGSLHREKYSILSALKIPDSAKNIVLGQYRSYKKLKEVPKNSDTETFVAMRLFIDRESWYKVPIYIRTGKKLHEKHSFVMVEIKKFPFQPRHEEPNRLIFELQPDEKINIFLTNPQEGNSEHLSSGNSLSCPGNECLPEHGNLILDVIGDRKLHFLSFPEIIASWRLTDDITDLIKNAEVKTHIYDDNSEGPKEQDELTSMDGYSWFDLH